MLVTIEGTPWILVTMEGTLW
jgi:hypothetical protein